MALSPEFWAKLQQAVDELLAKHNVSQDVRDAMQKTLATAPFQSASSNPMTDVMQAYATLYPTTAFPICEMLASELELELKELLEDHNDHQRYCRMRANWSEQENVRHRGFHLPYRGQAHDRLFRHVMHCRQLFLHPTEECTVDYPIFSIEQSTGFGKSRLLRELASTIALRELEKGTMTMQLVYVSIRDWQQLYYGSPPATPELAGHLFPRHTRTSDWMKEFTLKETLEKLFTMVMTAPWKPMNERLLRRFDGEDARITTALKAYQSKAVDVVPDERPKMMILALDEARALLPLPYSEEVGLGWLEILRRALKEVNRSIQKRFGSESMLLSIVVGALTTTANTTQRSDTKLKREMDPFVLTDTIDLFFDHGGDRLAAYKRLVLKAAEPSERKDSWKALRQFGRPLWTYGVPHCSYFSANEYVWFAAFRLVGGAKCVQEVSELKESNHFGVAALLCRLALRPRPLTALASRCVMDLMAVLSYLSNDHRLRIASYSSDPMLALGATNLWYSNNNRRSETDRFDTVMLPELRRLLVTEMLDTGGDGSAASVVARIVLLRAMDASAVVESRGKQSLESLTGAFVSVWSLLRTLHGDAPDLVVHSMDTLISLQSTAQQDASEEEEEETPEVEVPEEDEALSDASSSSSSEALLSSSSEEEEDHVEMPDDGSDVDESSLKMKSLLMLAKKAVKRGTLAALQATWEQSLVSFTHFVQLENEPSTNCLWAMLARRAAGVLPRDDDRAADLVIPVFVPGVDVLQQPPRVTMIVVQVGETPLDTSDTESMMFGAEFKALASLPPSRVLRVHMSLTDGQQSSRFYLRKDHDSLDGAGHAYVLCIQNIGEWTAKFEPLPPGPYDSWRSEKPKSHVTVMSKELAATLRTFLRPWWKAMEMVNDDVRQREKRSQDYERTGYLAEAVSAARVPQPANLLLNRPPRTGTKRRREAR